MENGIHLKYGHIHGGKVAMPWTMTDAEVIAAQSGRFVFRNVTTGLAEIADTTDVIFGWAEAGVESSTSGLVVNVIVDLTAVFRIPLIYENSSYTVNFSAVIKGECCDLKISSGVQYADPTNPSTKQLLIVGGKAATGTSIIGNDGYLDVMINPSALGNLAVGA